MNLSYILPSLHINNFNISFVGDISLKKTDPIFATCIVWSIFATKSNDLLLEMVENGKDTNNEEALYTEAGELYKSYIELLENATPEVRHSYFLWVQENLFKNYPEFNNLAEYINMPSNSIVLH